VPPVDLSRRAERDLRRLSKADRARVVDALRHLETEGENIDVKALAGRSPWRRMRVGERRVIFRPVDVDGELHFVVARIVERGDFDRAVRSLAD
jgi:mRNA-degrading endonuclease RelE of RelBE toxin-antitoxin system